MSEEYPSEPLPAREQIKESVAKLFQELGAANLTRRVLTQRLAIEYHINFAPHKKLLDEIVMEKIQEPALKKEVAKAAKKHQDGPAKGLKAKKAKEGKDGKEKKAKREKEEGEPTRAQSAFFLFSNEKRPALIEAMKADGGKVDVAAIGKKIGEMWKEVSAEEKAPYEAKAAEDKARYESEKAAWIAGGGGTKKDKAAKAKGDGPKRPQNALFLYMGDNREAFKKENPGASLGDVAKGLSAKFKELPEAERQVYVDKAAADKARYDAEVAALKA